MNRNTFFAKIRTNFIWSRRFFPALKTPKIPLCAFYSDMCFGTYQLSKYSIY